ncbi:MAG TPA: PBSX family phage terminase large subunit, partial [Candidatus Gemmiger excrementigallinarum]|nr:PBSX family phage terminase large subunit [Candidatus Gemmiger excrementigallinarum]
MALSEKQREILRFPYSGYDSLICDGAVRSGKTSIMALSFFLWAMGNFDGRAFAYCGKSVGSAERNIVTPLLGVTYLQKNFDVRYSRGEHVITARRGTRVNRFYLFGGRDASSYMLIQGITLAGVLLDEVALMPRSFVEQALLRCSVKGAKTWFNCNPDSSNHWFYKEWVLKAAERNALHLHFLLDDNPSLDEATKNWYKTSFRGIYYQRYVEGLWVAADGVIYDMFDATENVYRKEDEPKGLKYSAQRYIGVDYGTINDMVYLDAYDDGETLWITREYRWASREKMQQKTDTEYADDFMDFMGPDPQQYCPAVVDPSAASFKEELQRRGVYVIDANNDVLDGIRRVATL